MTYILRHGSIAKTALSLLALESAGLEATSFRLCESAPAHIILRASNATSLARRSCIAGEGNVCSPPGINADKYMPAMHARK